MLVDYRFEVFDFGQAVKDDRHVIPSDATIVEQDAIHTFVVDVLTSFCYSLAMTVRQYVVLQTQSLAVYLLKDREQQRILLKTLFEVFELWITTVIVFIHVTMLK